MRNYELIRLIHEELTTGSGKGSFSNPYLNTVITLTKLIEEERPEIGDANPPADWTNRLDVNPPAVEPDKTWVL